ncbi:hypothetical protein QBC47DRAFT_385916 [Echria macrotheca]|uniref:Uncharacterized protein n=1 Tax=Echria macrotheca TaxID=438768 RepID=A0AAJ0BE24_9PEZI|nr:hypothetical protein QBC47DRAFT_385916 [Echria macrotheca]
MVAPVHCMSRTVKTVTNLWHEWIVGIGGGPTIVTLDAGDPGGAPTGDRRLRLEIIREIRRTAELLRITEKAAAAFAAAEYRQLGFSSLDGYYKQNRANRKVREAG